MLRLLALSTALAAAGASMAQHATVQFPDSHFGRVAASYFESYNSGDAERMRAFEEKYRAAASKTARTIDDRLKQYGELRAEWGRLRPAKIENAAANELAVRVHLEAPNAWARFNFQFEPNPPHGMEAIRIEIGVGPPDGDKALDAAARRAIIDELSRELLQSYVFPPVAQKMADRLTERSAAGAYDTLTSPSDFGDALTRDLQDVSNDKHLRVRAAPQDVPRDSHGDRPATARRRGYGFREAKLLPGNVGYIKFDGFDDSDDAQIVAAGALGLVAFCDALIFDLRENGGGDPKMIQFISSYLFHEKTHLNSFYDRLGNKVSEFWTLETIPGRRFPPDLPVYVLTSAYTFSGAEEFSYNLKNLKRATIVGETTGGGAHPVSGHSIANGSMLVMVPFMRAENPISKTNWEGVGVEPDIKTSATAALDAALDDIRKRAAASGG